METFVKKKIEIVVEKPLMEQAIDVVDKLGARGYSVLPLIAGRGARDAWSAHDVSGAFDRVMIVVIVDASIADRLVSEAFELLERYNAIIYVSDVAVLRRDHF